MKIALACDHTAIELKTELRKLLEKLGHEIEDVGFFGNGDESSAYPIYGQLAAEKVIAGVCDRAILLCGTGFGISLAANKLRGIRCVNCSEPYTAMLSRQHNNSNALALGARVVGAELAKMIVQAWLDAEFEGGRHAERIKMIED